MYEDLKAKKLGYLGARVAKRMITDCYGRGVVRGAVETCNLIIKSTGNDPTAAESIKTAPVADISLQYPLKLLQCVAAEKPWPKEPCKPSVDKRNPAKPKVTECPPWTVYGGRGRRLEVHGLSAYEFARHFHIKQAKHPFSLAAKQGQDPSKFEAELTEKGTNRLTKKGQKLEPGTDYIIKEEGGDDWLPLGDGPQMQSYRHDWIIKLRKRPNVPVIFGAQSSRTTEEQAMRILVLFFPWVNNVKDASPGVPFVNHLWQPGMEDWTEALLTHASSQGFPTCEVKHLVMNFVFTYCLPRHTHLVDGLEENSDNEDLVDELADMELGENDLLETTLTHVRGNGFGDPAAEDSLDAEGEGNGEENGQNQEQAGPTRLYDMTMEMFRLSSVIWQAREGSGNEAARQRHDEVLRQSAAWVPDHDLALQAAKASDNSAKVDETGAGLLGGIAAGVEASQPEGKRFC